MRNRVSKARAVRPEDEFDDDATTMRGHMLAAIRRHPVDTLGLAVMAAMVGTTLTNALFLQSGKHPAPMRAIAAMVPPETTGSLVTPRPRPAEPQAAPVAPAQKQAALAPAQQPAGAKSADVVSDIQKELARKGFYDGAIDGVQGPRMDAALRAFEQAAGLKPGGAADEDMLALISHSRAKAKADPKADSKTDPKHPHAPKKADAAHPVPPGSVPAASPPAARVAAVQRALTEFGYGQLKTTGAFDPATKAAIEKFERERKLPVTGKLSDRVMKELATVTGRPLE